MQKNRIPQRAPEGSQGAAGPATADPTEGSELSCRGCGPALGGRGLQQEDRIHGATALAQEGCGGGVSATSGGCWVGTKSQRLQKEGILMRSVDIS